MDSFECCGVDNGDLGVRDSDVRFGISDGVLRLQIFLD